MNIFETAARNAFRFPAKNGQLTVEQLWDLPLTSTTGKANLNDVAVAIDSELTAAGAKNFVSIKPMPGKADLETKLEIVKHIIAVKQDENARALRKSQIREERSQLLDALARKKNQALEQASEEDILARLEALGEDA